MLREEVARSLAWYADNHDYFSDANFALQMEQGQVEALRYLGAPAWVFGFAMKLRAARMWMQRVVGRQA